MRNGTNMGGWDRVLRGIVGAGTLALGIWGKTPIGDVWDLVGVILLATSVSGYCLVYRVLGISTRPESHRGPSRVVHS
jgi:predicted benzoate:H+ symporter BenE